MKTALVHHMKRERKENHNDSCPGKLQTSLKAQVLCLFSILACRKTGVMFERRR